MRLKLLFKPKTINKEKLQVVIGKLTKLGVYHNDEIICDPEMDAQVYEILDELLPIKQKQN